MNVLFQNIPIGISKSELATFIETEFNMNSNLQQKLSIHDSCIEMMETQDYYCRPMQQFGIVRISSPGLSEKVIDRLNNCLFDKFKITVREYFVRSADNDRRGKLYNQSMVWLEKRVQERRQDSLMYSRQI